MKISGGQSLPALSSATADSALHEMLFSGGVLNKRLPGGEAVCGELLICVEKQ